MSLEHKSHSVSWASMLATQLYWRDAFEQKWPLENYHLFFEDIVPGTFPILLIWDKEIEDPSDNTTWNSILKENDGILNTTLETIAHDNPECCIIVMNDRKWKYDILLFRKKTDNELPLFVTEPVHSTAVLRWEQVGETLKLVDHNKIIQEKVQKSISNI
jgi:hypothetical protein